MISANFALLIAFVILFVWAIRSDEWWIVMGCALAMVSLAVLFAYYVIGPVPYVPE